ncbi:MAG TPA: metalloregulator ArsR/SmtB family transcription factor [Gemmatimonadales bacterium]|nr:metalloregulator ArsR/SmtB family transcription factor [Gemmatimonadales bacterium]
MPPDPSTADLLLAVAEPTRLRIVNCLAAGPLFVSELQALLRLPQPTVSRHLKVLREAGVVRDTPIARFVLYRLRRDGDARGRLLSAILEAVTHDERLRREREEAVARRRADTRLRLPPGSAAVGRSIHRRPGPTPLRREQP